MLCRSFIEKHMTKNKKSYSKLFNFDEKEILQNSFTWLAFSMNQDTKLWAIRFILWHLNFWTNVFTEEDALHISLEFTLTRVIIARHDYVRINTAAKVSDIKSRLQIYANDRLDYATSEEQGLIKVRRGPECVNPKRIDGDELRGAFTIT